MAVEIGKKAPAFKAIDQDGNTIQLKDQLGKKVILYFYPKDDTPGCTKQACNLRDNYKSLLKAGYVIYGVSINDEKSHQKFIAKYDLPFSLLVDTDMVLNEKYGVWVEKNMYGKKYMGTARTTFVIDEQGIIVDIISKVDTSNHTSQIIK
jgi:thioredoxin-dependent peroxiredoxin